MRFPDIKGHPNYADIWYVKLLFHPPDKGWWKRWRMNRPSQNKLKIQPAVKRNKRSAANLWLHDVMILYRNVYIYKFVDFSWFERIDCLFWVRINLFSINKICLSVVFNKFHLFIYLLLNPLDYIRNIQIQRCLYNKNIWNSKYLLNVITLNPLS